LDTGKVLFIWRGSKAENLLAFLAANIASSINLQQRNNEACIVDLSSMYTVVQTNYFLGSEKTADWSGFWSALRCNPTEVQKEIATWSERVALSW
jgi:hypothetical protein